MYITGLSRAVDPSDEDIENHLEKRYKLADDEEGTILWGGADTTLVKRDDEGVCRGFAFLAFYSATGAEIILDRINTYVLKVNQSKSTSEEDKNNVDTSVLPLHLNAELSNPKGKKTKAKDSKEKYAPDLRIRSRRKAPIRKHPVITSSDGKRTNLGNKTR